jgi:PAS domain S-box-containing protein
VARKVLNRATPVVDGDGSAPQSALAADIIIENAPDPVFVADLDGKILQANEAVSELLGFRQDEVVEQSLSRFISEEETREFTAALREVVERGVTRNAVLNPRSASGEIIPTSLNASALRDSEGNVIGAIGILRDMRELDKARAYAERLIEDAPDPVFVSDLEGKILQANEAVSQLLGFRQDEVVEQSVARFISPEETREFTAALREVVERGVTRNAVLNPRSASGEVIPTSLNASALRDSEGNVIGAIGVLRDMRELDKARAYAESLIENAPDPVFVSDLEGKILQTNEAVSQLLGFRQDEVVEQSVAREVIPTTLNASALRDADGNVIGAIGILRDMRAYEEVVRDLEQSRSELQEKILDLEKFEEVVVGRELKMIALEKELEGLQQEVAKLRASASG